MRLPGAIAHFIAHNDHRITYESAAEWLRRRGLNDNEIAPEDRAECIRTDEVWEIQWYPISPAGTRCVVAATLERALERANEVRS